MEAVKSDSAADVKNIKFRGKWLCKYGERCRDTHKADHIAKYAHPTQEEMEEENQKASKKRKMGGSDDANSVTPSKRSNSTPKKVSADSDTPVTFAKDDEPEAAAENFPKLPPIEIEEELPADFQDVWDDTHVRLPCSAHNTYRRKSNPDKELSKWYLIQSVLAEPIRNSEELQKTILSFHPKSAGSWDFSGLHSFFTEVASAAETNKFFHSTLPRIARLALRLPHLCKKPIPLLLPQMDSRVELSQMQIATILANAFFCTFPKQGGDKEEIAYQNVNFNTLFIGMLGSIPSNQAGKLRCLIHYFDRVTHEEPKGKVVFHRRVCTQPPDWAASTTPLGSLKILHSGLIEDDRDALQVDFANKMIGGGVLGMGCIQEEIRFVINPELIASLLFCAELRDNESLLCCGPERFSNYTGYGKTFEFTGDHRDSVPVGRDGVRLTRVVAIDALYFGMATRGRLQQWRAENVLRELNKFFGAIVGLPRTNNSTPLAVATGNWGCGNFGGYHDLKSIVQWMATSQAGCEMNYYTFEEPGLADTFAELAKLLQSKHVTVGDLFKILESTAKEMAIGVPTAPPQLYNVLFEKYE